MILYDFRCNSCETRFDEFARIDDTVIPCPECGQDARRLISTPRFDPKMGLDPDFATLSDKWAKRKEASAREAQRRAVEHGDER